MEFKICSIGCGRHATLNHGPSYRRYVEEHPGTILAACCDVDEQKAEAFKESFGFRKYYTDFNEMLASEKPDAVCLISPVEYTAEIAAVVLEMGYPLILEKPPGKDSEEVMKLIEMADKKKVPNRVAFNRRYTPMVQRLKMLINKNLQTSEIQNIYYCISRVDRTDFDFSTTAIHGIDAVRYISGSDYRHIVFRYQEFPDLGPGVKNIYMDCIMVNGIVARIDLCPVAGVVIERVVVNMHNRTFFLNIPMWNEYDTPGKLVSLYKGQVEVEEDGNEVSNGREIFETGGFYRENETFFEAVRAGKKPDGDLKSSLQSVQVADCIRLKLDEYHVERGDRH